MNTTTQTTNTSKFQETFEETFKVSPLQFIAEFRTVNNPEQQLEEAIQEFLGVNEDDEDFQDELTEWIEAANNSIQDYQQTLMEKHTISNRWDELDLTPDSKPNKLSNYTDTKFTIDATVQHNSQSQPISSRDIWDRTSGHNTKTIVLTEYGVFDKNLTDRTMWRWLNVNKVQRNGVEWITFGSIQINMSNGEFYCGVNKCEFAHQLMHSNRQVMEYQILRLLEHLGTHSQKNLVYPYPKFLKTPAVAWDNDYQKLVTHKRYCKNAKCKH